MRPNLQWLTICLLVCVITSNAHTQMADSPPTVRLESGILEGTQFDTAQNETAFLGVPYAAPPVGELRWKPTQPARKWNGPRQATQFGAACPQASRKLVPRYWLERRLPLSERLDASALGQRETSGPYLFSRRKQYPRL